MEGQSLSGADVKTKKEESSQKNADSLKLTEHDVGLATDLTFAVMNLISIEEHLFKTGIETENYDFVKLANDVRKVRGKMIMDLLKQIFGSEENLKKGEVYCASKHILATLERIMEVANRYTHSDNKEKSEEYLAYFLFLWDLLFDKLPSLSKS